MCVCVCVCVFYTLFTDRASTILLLVPSNIPGCQSGIYSCIYLLYSAIGDDHTC